MLIIYFAILALASANTVHHNNLRIVTPLVSPTVHRVNEFKTPARMMRLLRSPVQSVYTPVDQVQYVGQSHQVLNPVNPIKLQYSVVSVDPNIGHSVQITQPNDQQIVLTSVQPHRQQMTFLSTQPSYDKVISVGRVQPIDVQKQIVYQSAQPLTEDDKSDKQFVSVVQPDVYGQAVQSLRVGASVQPIQYSSVVQPVSTFTDLSPSIRLEGKAGHQLSYFVRGSDVVSQESVSQVYHPQTSSIEEPLQPPQYASVSLIDSQVSSPVIGQPKHVQVQDYIQPIQPKGRAINFNVNPHPYRV